ncbi:oligosaccharyl transferase delta subunit [Laetiporus sulphureus 93-53]|uniref:Ribophorin II n=1 Tax=Laetiporus sulphureus 93-53 TaxID=1314785 RepID=A0A165D001_9APHY|nr:oligosaccharyl transferase delta subunit [Laetiporus sulphureus 93-53]KZT03858.1 oligosaccharyl transferase delta subunit [Laetiporus sulphureus 93-53]
MRGFLWTLFPLLAAAGVYANALTLESPKITITGSDATQLRTESLLLKQKDKPVLSLGPTDVLKLTFQIVEKDGGKGVQPHQTFLRFYDEVSGEEGIQPVRVTAGGKAKFELNMAPPPLSLPPTTINPLKVTLLLGSFVHSPAKYQLFDLYVPESQPPPQHPDEVAFHLRPEIQHTFRPEQKIPAKAWSGFFAAFVFWPWLVLFGFWGELSPRVPNLLSPYIFPFIATLAAFEGLLIRYWIDLKLGQVLLYGAILAIPTAFTGKQALARIAQRRLGRK